MNLPKKYEIYGLLKGRANGAVTRALLYGVIKRPVRCSLCGGVPVANNPNSAIVGHHEDYTQEMCVVWMCRSCHRELHWEKVKHPLLRGMNPRTREAVAFSRRPTNTRGKNYNTWKAARSAVGLPLDFRFGTVLGSGQRAFRSWMQIKRDCRNKKGWRK